MPSSITNRDSIQPYVWSTGRMSRGGGRRAGARRPPSTRGGHGLEQEVHGAQGLDLFLELIRQLWAIATQLLVCGDAPALLPELLPAQQELDRSIFP